MTKPDFAYTTYIKTTPEKLWQALTNPEFTRQYWGYNVSDWKKGSDWKHQNPAGTATLAIGKVLESHPPKKLVLSWINPENKNDTSQVTFEIEPIEDLVRLSVSHTDFTADSMRVAVSGGWPRVLSSLKSLLESGKALNTWAGKEPCKGTAA